MQSTEFTMKSLFPALFILTFIILATTMPAAVQAQQESLGVMTYNIRYDNPDDAPNTWDNRKKKVTNLIQFYEPVFLGTQEALFHQLKDIDNTLPDYRWIGQGRDDGKKEGEFSALFYDRRKVELVANTDSTIWLSKTPNKPSKNWDAALPRILTWGEFEIKSSGNHIFVFNTHFDHVGETARAESAKIILDTIEKVAGDNPVVLTGDFNILDDSKPYQLLTSSFLTDAIHASELPHTGAEFTYSGFEVSVPSDGRRIDYIFTNNRVEVLKHATITTFRDGYFPSDHLPVLTEINLK